MRLMNYTQGESMKAVVVEKPMTIQQVTLKDVFKVGRREVVECMIEDMRVRLLARRADLRTQLEEARNASSEAYEVVIATLEAGVEKAHDLESMAVALSTLNDFKEFSVDVAVPGSVRAKRFSYSVRLIRSDKWRNTVNLHKGTLVLTKKQKTAVKAYLDSTRVPKRVTKKLEAVNEELGGLGGLKRRVNLELTRKVLFDTPEGKQVLGAFKALAGVDMKALTVS